MWGPRGSVDGAPVGSANVGGTLKGALMGTPIGGRLVSPMGVAPKRGGPDRWGTR